MTEGALDSRILSNVAAELAPEEVGAFLNQIVALFDENCARMLQELTAAVVTCNYPVARQTAHSLKSSASTVGACALARECQNLEDLAKAGQAADLAPALDALETALKATRQVLPSLISALSPCP